MIINVNASLNYDIVIEKGIAQRSGELINKIIPTCKVLVVTDDFIPSKHSDLVVDSLNKVGYKTVKYVIPHGEGSKSIQEYAKMLSFMADKNFSRKDLVVAVGGGVVGDLAGFVASTFMRGIKFVNMPTTLLACIDSSVGGKTGIDLPSGKNLVGTFYQPSMVICDSEFLKTLPDEIYKDGLGEAIKYGIMEKSVWKILKNGIFDIDDFIYKCLKIKVNVVEQDEKEGGLRQVLNLGHTFGHAIETLSNYTILHGFAVSKGIAIMAKLSKESGDLTEDEEQEILSVISSFGIDYSCPYSLKQLKEVIYRDKKASNGKVNLIYIEKIGKISIINTDIDGINL